MRLLIGRGIETPNLRGRKAGTASGHVVVFCAPVPSALKASRAGQSLRPKVPSGIAAVYSSPHPSGRKSNTQRLQGAIGAMVAGLPKGFSLYRLFLFSSPDEFPCQKISVFGPRGVLYSPYEALFFYTC